MKLAKLLERLEYEVIQGTKEIDIAKVVNHSKDAEYGSLFVCITGMLTDGCAYIGDAVSRGAVAVVTERDVNIPREITVIRVENTRKALAKIAAAFYGYPSEELITIGVTGTKGKTTTTCMIRDILEQAGHKAGLIGTIEVQTGKRSIPSEHTSPESVVIQKYLREMVEAGCDTVVMEVSSQGLKLHRVDEILFDIGVFMNLGEDHIGKYEHADFEEYKCCKAQLFRQCRLGIFNMDSPYWKDMLKTAECRKETFGFQKKADYILANPQLINTKNALGISYSINETPVRLSMPGEFNVYNSAAAFIVCKHLGVSLKSMQSTLKSVQVRGRVERVEIHRRHVDFTIMIDYAHNAMSLQSILEMVHSYNPARIVTIFGCGGNRAKDRRYEMGEVSGKMADLTIITSDNPRYEDPAEIMNDIRSGIEKTDGKYMEICDRKEAIRHAVRTAKEGDVIILAGKGHEDYQEIEGIKYHMDDRELVHEVINELDDLVEEEI